MILFLASSRASAVTGRVTYPVDGGILTAQPLWEIRFQLLITDVSDISGV